MNFSQLGLLATIRTTSLTVDVSRLLQSLRRTPLPAGVEFAEPCFSFILFVFIRFFFHCLPSACPAFACVSHQTEASPMARASVLGCLGGAKVVTGFEGEGKAWREFCRRKRPGERGKTELFFPPVPLPSHWGGGRKHRGRRDRQEVSAKQKALKIKNSNLVKRSVSTFCHRLARLRRTGNAVKCALGKDKKGLEKACVPTLEVIHDEKRDDN